jgi:hypothetical protein
MPGALTIARLAADCEIAGAPDTAPAIADRTDAAVRLHLPENLRRAFTPWFDGDDESVWIVRRLDVSVAIAASAAPDEIASALTTALAGALAAALRGAGDGTMKLRFDDHAAYLSQFVVDAAAGSAWDRWYYAPLAGVRLLPASAAIRTVLAADPMRGLASLSRLNDHALARVVSALCPEDETRLLQAFASAQRADPQPAGDVYVAAWSGWTRALRGHIDRGRALFAFVRADGAPPSFALRDAVCAIGEAMPAAALNRWSTIPPRAFTHQDDNNEAPSSALPPVANIVPEWIAHAIASLEKSSSEPARSGTWSDSPAEPMATPFGGLLLLLRDLDAGPWARWTAGWPMRDTLAPAALLKWLIVIACAGRVRAAEAARDPVLRAFFGIPSDLTMAGAAKWLRLAGAVRREGLARQLAELDDSAVARSRAARLWLTMPRASGVSAVWSITLASAANAVLEGFARRLPGFAESTPEHLWRNFLDFEAMAELEPDRVVVRCGRPPLHLVLTLTGMTRGLLAGHDAGGRPWLLFARD